MSSFRKLFGSGGGKGQPADTKEASAKLRELEEVHQRKCEYLEQKIEKEVEFAKANATKNKTAAMAALRRKKKLESDLQQVQGILTNLETQRETLDNARVNAEIFRAMHQTGTALKKEHNELNADKVHKIMDNFEDQQYLAKEITDAISTPIAGSLVDEDDLLAELAELEEEKLEQELLNVGPTFDLPAVPVAVGSSSAGKATARHLTDEERELEELAAQMAS